MYVCMCVSVCGVTQNNVIYIYIFQSPDDLNEVQVRQLRGVLPGISAHTIRALPRNSLLRNLDVFEDAHLDGDEGAALAERVMGDDS